MWMDSLGYNLSSPYCTNTLFVSNGSLRLLFKLALAESIQNFLRSSQPLSR